MSKSYKALIILLVLSRVLWIALQPLTMDELHLVKDQYAQIVHVENSMPLFYVLVRILYVFLPLTLIRFLPIIFNLITIYYMQKLFEEHDPSGLLTILTFFTFNVWLWTFLLYTESLWIMLFFATLYYYKKGSNYYLPALLALLLTKNYIPLLIVLPMYHYSRDYKHLLIPLAIITAFIPLHLTLVRDLFLIPFMYPEMIKHILIGTGQIIPFIFVLGLKGSKRDLIPYILMSLPFLLTSIVGEGRYTILLSLITLYSINSTIDDNRKVKMIITLYMLFNIVRTSVFLIGFVKI